MCVFVCVYVYVCVSVGPEASAVSHLSSTGGNMNWKLSLSWTTRERETINPSASFVLVCVRVHALCTFSLFMFFVAVSPNQIRGCFILKGHINIFLCWDFTVNLIYYVHKMRQLQSSYTPLTPPPVVRPSGSWIS